MTNITFQERIIESNDWATLLFLIAFLLIVVTKTAFENRFYDFMRLIVSDKYIKIYKDSSNLMSWFTVLLFIVQVLSFSFYIQLMASYFGLISKTDTNDFARIATFLGVFILSKFLIEKIIATSFNIEEFTEQFNLQKVSYRTYIGILLFPITVFLFYNNRFETNGIYIIGALVLLANVLIYLKILKIYQNLILSKLFYFILYLCALEIAPYYFIYYWFTRS